jgi:antitoxin component YwqK of YwqJK toxin-antitoxin module
MKTPNSMFYLSLALASVLAGLNVYAADQSICHSGANVLLYDNGSLKACLLEKDYDANGIQCKSNNSVSFYNNGNLESCVLSKPATLDMNKCKEDGLISFYIDGKLKSCVKPDN